MTHHGAKAGQGWKYKLAAAREALDNERALTRTLRSYVEKRDASIRLYEDANAVLKQLGAEVAVELAELKAHPVVKVKLLERERLPDTRRAVGIKLRINGVEGKRCATCGGRDPDAPPVTSLHLHLGFYDDGRLGEVFIRLDRERRSDVASAFADQWATAISYALQHDLQASWLLEKARYVRDGSGGVPYVWNQERERYERHPEIHSVTSVVDYLSAVIERVLAGKPAVAAEQRTNAQPTEETDHVQR